LRKTLGFAYYTLLLYTFISVVLIVVVVSRLLLAIIFIRYVYIYI